MFCLPMEMGLLGMQMDIDSKVNWKNNMLYEVPQQNSSVNALLVNLARNILTQKLMELTKMSWLIKG